MTVLEQMGLWRQQHKLVRLVTSYGNNTVRAWVGYLHSFDQVGVVLEVPPTTSKAGPKEAQLICFPWYTATEISTLAAES